MEKEKRIVRAYKIDNKSYEKAKKRATKEKLALATLIEVWVISYGNRTPYFIDGYSPINV